MSPYDPATDHRSQPLERNLKTGGERAHEQGVYRLGARYPEVNELPSVRVSDPEGAR